MITVQNRLQCLVNESVTGDLDFFAADLWESLLAERSECCNCEFFENCGGYFKWPNKDYKCDGVMELKAISSMTIYWQGGEIMLLPPDWFEHARELIQKAADRSFRRDPKS